MLKEVEALREQVRDVVARYEFRMRQIAKHLDPVLVGAGKIADLAREPLDVELGESTTTTYLGPNASVRTVTTPRRSSRGGL